MALQQILVLLSITLVLCVSGQQSVTMSLYSIGRRLEAIEQMFLFLNVSRDEDPSMNRTVFHSCPVDFYNHEPTLSCYRILTDVKSWYDARTDCQTQGADLVWFESREEYRHVVIKLLTDITDTQGPNTSSTQFPRCSIDDICRLEPLRNYNNAGYWTGANDITEGGFVWGDTASKVDQFFYPQPTPKAYNPMYGYNSRQTTPSPTNQKHCVFMKYARARMQINQDVSECDGGRLYICKCKTDRSDHSGCSKSTVSGKLPNSDKAA